jgi:hypothetical protein
MVMRNGEYAFEDGIKKLSEILTGMAGELDDLAESLEADDDELAGQVDMPLANALESISTILNGTAKKVMAVNMEQAEEALNCIMRGNDD